MPFVKLDCGILDSSLWIDREAREVFLTALLMAVPHELTAETPELKTQTLDQTGWLVPAGWYGLIRAAGVGILRRAGVDLVAGIQALETLAQPDAASRSKAFDGRRLVRIDGGFLALNYMEYRERDYTAAARARRYRASRRDVTRERRNITHADADADADAEVQKDQKPDQERERKSSRPARSRSLSVPDGFEAFWEAYPRKVAKPTAIRAWTRQQPPLEAVLDAVTRTTWSDDPHFIPHPATWLNARRWEDVSPPASANGLPFTDRTEHWADECHRLGHQPPCPNRTAHWLVKERTAHA